MTETLLVVVAALTGMSEADGGTLPAHTAPLHDAVLESGPHLFLDDALIANTQDVSFTLHSPVKYEANPILTGENSLTGLDKVAAPFTVFHTPENDLFRMWYVPHSRSGLGYHMGVGTSADGISWDLPDLGILEFQGSTHNNLVVLHVIGGVVLFDPRTPKPDERYKTIFYRHDPKPVGFSVAFSPDGLHWGPLEFIEELDDSGDRSGTGASDIVNAFYDPVREEFVAVFKMWSREGQFTVPVKRGTPAPRCGRRVVGISRSKDFRNWSKAKQVLLPDADDAPTHEFYGVPSIVRRGGLYIGFLPCLIDDAPPDGIGWTELAVSRDGDTWHRIREPFLDRAGDEAGAVDHAIAWVTEVAQVGGMEHVYYTGCEAGHKLGNRFACLATMRKDGFVSVDAGPDGGALATHPFQLTKEAGRALRLNVDAPDGEVRVQVSADGKAIPGYTFDDCVPVTGDDAALPVSWKGGTSLPDSGPLLQISFQMRSARLYAFEFAAPGGPK
ncbi:MAG: hypothetical protein GY851_15740 [bacterium]|nr:hypothetical protein [bacterium]